MFGKLFKKNVLVTMYEVEYTFWSDSNGRYITRSRLFENGKDAKIYRDNLYNDLYFTEVHLYTIEKMVKR